MRNRSAPGFLLNLLKDISILVAISLLVVSCELPWQASKQQSILPSTPAPAQTPFKMVESATPVLEYPVKPIPLTGLAAQPAAEISGLAWYGEYLILLPQFPKRMRRQDDGALLALPRKEITDFIDGVASSPLTPIEIPFHSGGIEGMITGYEGFEAVCFLGEQIFLTIEARNAIEMTGYLVTGTIQPDLSEIRLEVNSLVENKLQANWDNKSDETLLLVKDTILSIYEINGTALNPGPHASQFDASFHLLRNISFPSIEYRVTDAAELDSQQRFWIINYFFPGETFVAPDQDPLAMQFGEGPTHARYQTVERLVEMQYSDAGITFTSTPPVQIELLGDDQSRNWEGLVRLENRGFLLVTDKFPETILGFVAYP